MSGKVGETASDGDTEADGTKMGKGGNGQKLMEKRRADGEGEGEGVGSWHKADRSHGRSRDGERPIT